MEVFLKNHRWIRKKERLDDEWSLLNSQCWEISISIVSRVSEIKENKTKFNWQYHAYPLLQLSLSSKPFHIYFLLDSPRSYQKSLLDSLVWKSRTLSAYPESFSLTLRTSRAALTHSFGIMSGHLNIFLLFSCEFIFFSSLLSLAHVFCEQLALAFFSFFFWEVYVDIQTTNASKWTHKT